MTQLRRDPGEPPRHAPLWFLELTLIDGLVAAGVVLALSAWLSVEVLSGQTRAFDAWVRGAVHTVASPALTRVMLAATGLGAPAILVPVGVVTAFVFWRRGWTRAAVLLPVTMLGAGLLDAALKVAFRRPRPSPFFDYPAPTSYGFPSGHALFSFCFFAIIAALLSPRIVQRPWRVALWVIAIALIAVISVSRIYLGVHHPTDVVAGWGVGFVWVVAVAFGDRVAARRFPR